MISVLRLGSTRTCEWFRTFEKVRDICVESTLDFIDTAYFTLALHAACASRQKSYATIFDYDIICIGSHSVVQFSRPSLDRINETIE
uniref:Uncharacterized protein n=1 Tax=Onchocerca volvulus TaxID=6282 RepID=A0A8R1Y075_ONCVO